MKSSISSLLERLVEVKNAIANAIVAKGGTVNEGDGLEEFVGDIADIPTGGGTAEVEIKDVNFYDYNGTITNSYTAEEFASLSAMPPNPSHSGLTSQGWNWSLSDAKTYVAANRLLNICQMYTTTDGATKFHIDILNPQNLSFYLCLRPTGTLTIDWGDGSSTETMTANDSLVSLPHTYASTGKYVISVMSSSGTTWKLDYNNNTSVILRSATSDNATVRYTYLNLITEINFGSGITEIGDYGCAYLYSLKYFTMPNTITSINKYAFNYCYSLRFIGIPNSVLTLKQNCFQYCATANVVVLPNSITTFNNSMFTYCTSVTSLTIPSSMTNTMDTGFGHMYLMRRLVIPTTLTVIYSGGFYDLTVCSYVKFISSTPPNVYTSSAFYNLNKGCLMLIPLASKADYFSASNYPDKSVYTYIEYATYADGETLPTISQDEAYTYVWYATTDDWKNQTNPITVGNGKEIYCRSTAVS